MACRLKAALTRKKPLTDEASKLARVLNLLDLTGLGVGSTLGLGVYVLAGAVAKNEAGPAACISFLIAAIASAFAGLCYAEFAARVPKAGSAYVYSYVSVGEFVAYVIGWNLILEYVIGTASVARGLSNYIDALMNYKMKNTLTEMFPIGINFLSSYPDFLSFVLIMILTVLLARGVKESTLFNNIFTALNLITVTIVLVAGFTKADLNNWRIPKEKIPPGINGGEGGFMPFGIAGVMAGASKCFFGFVGFDCIATTGEEAKNPQRNIPLAIVASLIIIFLAYFGISTVLTMMWPYYLQDENAPFPHVFEQVGWPVIKWIVTIGAIFALCTTLLGAMFPLPRILYAMATDGLLFRALSKIHRTTKTPRSATIISGLLAGLMAMIFDLKQLIDMMSIGTLLAYTIVAICVLILRYEEESDYQLPTIQIKRDPNIWSFLYDGFKQLFNLNRLKEPNSNSASITKWATLSFSIFSIILCSCVIYIGAGILNTPFYLAFLCIVSLSIVIIVCIIYRQPTVDITLSFKVPGVPLIPCLSVLINSYLMLELDLHTWIRFGIWLLIGLLIYFTYSIKHSKAAAPIKENKVHLPTISTLQRHVNDEKLDETNEKEKQTTKF